MQADVSVSIRQVAEQFRIQLREHKTKYSPEIDKVLDRPKLENTGLSGKPKPRPAPKPDPEIIAPLSSRLEELAERGNEVATELAILKSLKYPSMKFRHSSIADAHPFTFQWMFSGNFVNWLQSHESIYWISGKPGSGKSTLMKHLIDNPETMENLRHWSGADRLVTASFFFWALGSHMQKSQKGLLQSLLFELLAKSPELISVTFPSRWRQTGFHELELDPDMWTMQELFEAFRRFKEHGTSCTKFCFFLDGLDEYEGDHQKLIEVVRELVHSSNIKLCVSSRPWNVFEAAFGHNSMQKVYVQDLNERDIQRYVRDKLEVRFDFQEMKERDARCDAVVVELVDKAQGVFLWVHLVVRSLIEGLQNCDRIVDLQRRLRGFPSDLEDYFQHIFDSLDPIYRAQTARAFQVALAASRPMTLLNYWFLDSEEEDSQFALKCKIQPLDEGERRSRNSEMQKRLNGRCKGLLEVTEVRESEMMIQHRVDFLHRTVKDFLMINDMQKMLSDWTPPGFGPHITICKTILAEIKTTPVIPEYFENLGPLSDWVEEIMNHVREVEILTKRSPREILDDLERTIATYAYKIYVDDPHQALNMESYPWSNWTYQSRRFRTAARDTFLTFAIERNLLLYVQSKFADNTGLLIARAASKGRPLLDYVAGIPDSRWEEQERLHHLSLVALLLQHGANPNEMWNSASVWGNYLYFLSEGTDDWPRQLYYELCKTFIVYGAELHKAILCSPANLGNGREALALIPSENLARILPQEDVAELFPCWRPFKSASKKNTRSRFLGWMKEWKRDSSKS